MGMLEAARVTTSLLGRVMEAARFTTPNQMGVAEITFAYEEETMNQRIEKG